MGPDEPMTVAINPPAAMAAEAGAFGLLDARILSEAFRLRLSFVYRSSPASRYNSAKVRRNTGSDDSWAPAARRDLISASTDWG